MMLHNSDFLPVKHNTFKLKMYSGKCFHRNTLAEAKSLRRLIIVIAYVAVHQDLVMVFTLTLKE